MSRSGYRRKDIMALLSVYFGDSIGGRIRAGIWYMTNNPLLGGVAPKHMVQQGRGAQLVQFINEQFRGEFKR